MLTRAQKEEQVAELTEKLSRATCVYLADYRGLDVESVNALRGAIRTQGAGDFEYRVTKNAVLRRACEGSGVANLAEQVEGPTALALSYGDPVGLAKILVEFSKAHEVFELKAGVLEGRSVDQAEIAKIATLPTLDEARSQIVGLLMAPAGKLVRLLAEPGSQVARLLESRRAQLEASGGA